ncbi:MAG: Plug domain-containing protein, partial [Myxococcales bacterium]|nr:Plug domain-containing protein [Myxococcales bacterium]
MAPWVALLLLGQVETSTSATEVLVVVGSRLPPDLEGTPYATTTLEQDELHGGRPTLSIGEALSQVPGVFTFGRNNFAQDTRIAIRGFGARSPFGVRGIRILLDGIPLTSPSGQSQLDTLDPAFLGRAQILRGPAGSLYGNASGGVILLRVRAS